MNAEWWRQQFREGIHVVVGRGRLGTTLANALSGAGRTVGTDHSSADFLWFCVPESQLTGDRVQSVIAQNPSAARIHTSGFAPASVLGQCPGGPVASLHPAYSFPDPLTTMPPGVFWTMEGDAVLFPALIELVDDWQGNHAVIPADQKPAYHIVCVLLANLSLVPVTLAAKLVEEINLPLGKLVGSLTLPPLRAAVENGTVPGMTGPAARGDRQTVERQLHWLKEHHPGIADIYEALSMHILKRDME